MNRPSLCYLDNNATTRVAPEVVEAMLPFLAEQWGNPSNACSFGKRAAKQLKAAREKAAAFLHADPSEIVFTSGATESINTAIHSALVTQPEKRHILTTAVEHSAGLRFCEFLQRRGFAVTLLPVRSDGSLDLALLEQSIQPDTALVSVMWANNETGVIFPIKEIAAIGRAKGVLTHSDAVQVAGKLPIDVNAVGVDMLSLSAHKFHAPKGVGLLYVRRGTRFQPLLIGGGQEQGRRSGTENVASIVGLGRAAELAMASVAVHDRRVRALRDKLEAGILRAIPDAAVNGAPQPRLPNTTNLAFPGIEAQDLLLMLDRIGVCASAGSACLTGSPHPSHVLTAMGRSREQARSSVRFSLGIDNTEADVDYVLERLPPLVERLRDESALLAPRRPGR